MAEFNKLGITASTQNYTFAAHTGVGFPCLILDAKILTQLITGNKRNKRLCNSLLAENVRIGSHRHQRVVAQPD